MGSRFWPFNIHDLGPHANTNKTTHVEHYESCNYRVPIVLMSIVHRVSRTAPLARTVPTLGPYSAYIANIYSPTVHRWLVFSS